MASLASQLAGDSLPIEAQHLGLKLLQHLVSFHDRAQFSDSTHAAPAQSECKLTYSNKRNIVAEQSTRSQGVLINMEVMYMLSQKVPLLSPSLIGSAFQVLPWLQIMFRWQEFAQHEQHELATMCYNLFKGSGNASTAWIVRSKSSLLLSLVTKRMGQPFWEQLLRELLPYATRGPIEAEKVIKSALEQHLLNS